MIVKLLLLVVFYAALVFAITFATILGERSADGLAKLLNPRRLMISAGVAAVIVAVAVAFAFHKGWIKPGSPNDSPGFETGRPEAPAPVKPATPPPTIKKRVPKTDMDSASKDHQDKLDRFEDKPSDD